jgi:RNA polymerase sigma factor (sigma-70 family)
VSLRFPYQGLELTLDEAFSLGITTSDLLSEYDSWLHRRAGQLLRSHDHADHDDLAQEGRIGMWRGLDKYDDAKGALPSWLTTNANWRMKEVLSRKAWTGMPSRAGRQDLGDISILNLDVMMEDEESVVHLLTASELLEGVEWAYHQGEIARALETLTPGQRRYVYLRFWAGVGGKGTTGLASLKEWFGYDPTSMWAHPQHGARRRLERALATLR